MVLAEKLRRPSALATAALLLLASLVPLLAQKKASAYGLVANREIKMSSSANGATAAGQGVDYRVAFNVATDATNIEGVVVDFCANSPIIGDTCTAPTGFSVSAATLTLGTGLTGFTKDAAETTANKFVLSGAAYNPGVAQAIDFTLVGVDNPENANTSFYARIVTFSTDEGAEDYDSSTANVNNPGAEPPVIDAGGIALSTTAQITVTSKVQERLTFCVYTDGNGDLTVGDPNYTNCTGVAGTAVALGDDNGVLSDAGSFVDKTAMYNVSTNASNNVTIRAKGTTLTSGLLTIDAAGGTTPGDGTTETAAAASHGTEQFGFCTYRDTGGGVAGLTAVAPYDDADCAAATDTAGDASPGTATGLDIAFDLTTVNDNLSTTFGDTIATKTPGGQSTGVLVFVGNIATTTEPGIYTSTMTFIATGNY